LWPNGWMHQDATGMEAGLGRGDFVFDGDPAPSPKIKRRPQFSARVYFGETAGCIKVALGMQVGLGPGQNVLDWDPAPPKKGHSPPPISGPCLLLPNGPISTTAEHLFKLPRAKDILISTRAQQ